MLVASDMNRFTRCPPKPAGIVVPNLNLSELATTGGELLLRSSEPFAKGSRRNSTV